MEKIKTYEEVMPIGVCEEIIDRINIILGRPDPGSGVKNHNNKVTIDARVYGSLKEYEDQITDAVWYSWYDYNKTCSVSDRTFPEVFYTGWEFAKQFADDYKETAHQTYGRERSAFASWKLYLNTTGGNDVFADHGVQVKPETNKLVIYPASYAYKSKMVGLTEDKYIATGWFEYPDRGGIRK